jgi:hypothetical protein
MSNALSQNALSSLRDDYRRSFEKFYGEIMAWSVREDDGSIAIDRMVDRGEMVAHYLFELTRLRQRVRAVYERAGFERTLEEPLKVAARDFLWELNEDGKTLDQAIQLWLENVRVVRQMRARSENRF